MSPTESSLPKCLDTIVKQNKQLVHQAATLFKAQADPEEIQTSDEVIFTFALWFPFATFSFSATKAFAFVFLFSFAFSPFPLLLKRRAPPLPFPLTAKRDGPTSLFGDCRL